MRNAAHRTNALRVLWSAFVVDAANNKPDNTGDNVSDGVNDNDGFSGFVVNGGGDNGTGNNNGNNGGGCLDGTVALARVIPVVSNIDDADAASLERFRAFAVCASCKDSLVRGVVPSMCVAEKQ